MEIDKEKIKEGLKKTKHIEELDSQLKEIEKLRLNDKEFDQSIKQLRNIIKKKFIK